MKKLLSILLAAATVFSTTAFASPAAEPIETADEISLDIGGLYSSNVNEASLTAETAAYYDASLGVKLIDEDFESGDISKWTPAGSVSTSIAEDSENGKSLKVSIPAEHSYPAISFVTPIKKAGEFTVSAQYKYDAGKFSLRHALRHSANNFYDFAFSANLSDEKAGQWQSPTTKTLTVTASQMETNGEIIRFYIIFNNTTDGVARDILVDNIKLYYKPTDKTEYKVISAVYPTVTVGAPEGIEANAVLALTAEPQKYFGSLVDKCVIDGNTITLTVNGEGKVELPSVVNADKTKTYTYTTASVEAVDELAPWRGVKLIDENFESAKTGDTYSSTAPKVYNDRSYATEGAGTTGELVENVDGVGDGKYVKVSFSGATQYPVFRAVLDNSKDASTGIRIQDYITIPATYTASANIFFDDADVAAKILMRPAVRNTNAGIYWTGGSTLGSGVWSTITGSVSVKDEDKTVREMMIGLINDSKIAGSAYVDDIKLYYKPNAADAYGDITVNYPTITVNVPNGIEAKAAEAIKANPSEYLSCAVSAVSFTDTSMTITLDEDEAVNYAYIKIPALVNAAKDKTYPETKIQLPDYYSVVYGLRNYLWNAGNKDITETGTENQSYYASYSFKNTEGFDYISLVSKIVEYPRSLNYVRDTSLPYDTNHTYTYISKARFAGNSCLWLRKVDSSAGAYNVDKRYTKPNDNTWTDIVFKDYTLPEGKTISQNMPDIYVGSNVFKENKGINADVAYIGLYYRPIAEDANYTAKFSGNTVTVTYADGIDADTAEALELFYTKYFNGDVSALTVNGNDVVMTLADGVTEITVPKLVNKAGTATYAEVTVNTAVYPTSLSDETTIRAVYPAGLRFKASVETAIMENAELTEFGYIVARAEKLEESGLADLTAGIDSSVLRTITSPSFKRVDGTVTINKYEAGTENTTFAAVLVNIPSANYGDKFAVRPYVVYGGEYYYGETMKASILEVANSLKDTASGDVLDVVNKIINGEKLEEYKG